MSFLGWDLAVVVEASRSHTELALDAVEAVYKSGHGALHLCTRTKQLVQGS